MKRTKSVLRDKLMGTPGKNKKLDLLKKKAAKTIHAVEEEEKEEEPVKKIWDDELEKLQLTQASWPKVWRDMGVPSQSDLRRTRQQAMKAALVRRKKLQWERMKTISVLKPLYPDPLPNSRPGSSFVHVVAIEHESEVPSPALNMADRRAAPSTDVLQIDVFNIGTPMTVYIPPEKEVSLPVIRYEGVKMARTDVWGEVTRLAGKRCSKRTIQRDKSFNQSRALHTWAREMGIRQHVKQSLAGTLTRPEHDLLMTTCEDYSRRRRAHVPDDPSRDTHPLPAFWKLGETLHGTEDIRFTLTSTEKGYPPDIAVSGCTDSTIKHNGDLHANRWHKCDYMQSYHGDLDHGEEGKIHMTDNLGIDAMKKCEQPAENSSCNAIGQKVGSAAATNQNAPSVAVGQKVGSVAVTNQNAPSVAVGQKVGSATVTNQNAPSVAVGQNVESAAITNKNASCVAGSQSEATTNQNASCVASSLSETTTNKNASCVAGSQSEATTNQNASRVAGSRKLKPAVSSHVEQTSAYACTGRYRILGPCLLVDRQFLFWKGSGDACDLSNTVAKETLFIMEAKVHETVKSTVVIENEGSTTIQYCWSKLKQPQHFTIPKRKQKQKFYFNDDAGILCPGEKITVPVIFNSDTACRCTESWALSTQPVLMGGAQILFTFKGLAVAEDLYAEARREIGEQLQKQEKLRICEDIVKETFKIAVEVGIEREGQLKDDPITISIQELFLEKNPGLYYHRDVISRLCALRDTVTMVTPSPDDDTADIAAGSDEHVNAMDTVGSDDGSVDETESVLCLSDLKQIILRPPGSETADEAEVHAERELRLAEFHAEANLLSFAPLEPNLPHTRLMYSVLFGLLQMGVDSISWQAEIHAYHVGLTTVDPRAQELLPTPPESEVEAAAKSSTTRKKSRAGSVAMKTTMSRQKAGSTVTVAPPIVPPLDLSPGNSSTGHELTAEEREAAEANHHQRLYIDMYCMLVDTVETMTAMFPSPYELHI